MAKKGGGDGKGDGKPNFSKVINNVVNAQKRATNVQINQEKWARKRFKNDRKVTNEIVQELADNMDVQKQWAEEDRERYTDVYQPLEDSYIQQADKFRQEADKFGESIAPFREAIEDYRGTIEGYQEGVGEFKDSAAEYRAEVQRLKDEARAYASDENRQLYQGRAQADVAQSFEAKRQSALRELESFGASDSLKADMRANRERKLGEKLRSLWDALRVAVADAFGVSHNLTNDTLLDAMMQVGSELESAAQEGNIGAFNEADTLEGWNLRRRAKESPVWMPDPDQDFLIQETTRENIDTAKRVLRGEDLQPQYNRPWMTAIRTTQYLADKFTRGGKNAAKEVQRILENIATTSHRNQQEHLPLIQKAIDLERKYHRNADAGKDSTWTKFVKYLHDETVANAYGDRPLSEQKHLKDTDYWNKARHADLAKRHQELSQYKDLMAFRHEAMDFYRNEQNEATLASINNQLLKALGIKDAALAQRIFNDETTDADTDKLGPDLMDAVKKSMVYSKIAGPYFPLMRRGKFVVQANRKLETPAGGRLVPTEDGGGDNVFEFKTQEAAAAYARSNADLPARVESIYVDKNKGTAYVTDESNNTIRITKQDFDAEQRWRVTVQNRLVDFYPSGMAARRAAKALEDEGGWDVAGVEQRRYEDFAPDSSMLSSQITRMSNDFQNREGFKKLSPEAQAEVIKGLRIQSLRLYGSTRVQSRRIPRRNVLGFSNDFVQNMMDYSTSMSGFLSRMEHTPALDDAVDRMNEQVRDDYSAGTLSRSAIANEIKHRIAVGNGFREGNNQYSPTSQRLMTFSFISNLASAAYSMVNATQPVMTSYPLLAARYGYGKAMRMMTQAMRDIGYGKIVGQGLAGTVKRITNPNAAENTFVEDIKERLSNPREKEAIDYWVDHGGLSADAGFEIDTLSRSRRGDTLRNRATATLVDTPLSWAEGIARQLPKAMETNNRAGVGLAAYRMEFTKNGGNHKAAMDYALDVINQTQFLYTATNRPPAFNHPLMRLALQFKQYPMGMYELLGGQLSKAYHNTHPGDRAEALRAVAGIAAAHLIVAGTLGLPTEPIKIMVLAFSTLTGAGLTWQDVEDAERDLAANVFGSEAGEVITRGVTRALPGGFSFDLSSRIGLNSLALYGEPKSDSYDDIGSWLAGLVGGPQWGSTAKDFIDARDAINSGDPLKAAAKAIPFKAISDSLDAYRVATEGKKTSAGRLSMEPYRLPEAILKGLGLRPGREAETQDLQRSFYRRSSVISKKRADLMQDWAAASPSERMKLWGQIETWNKGQAEGSRVTRKNLDSYVKTRKTEERTGRFRSGVKTDRTTEPALERAERIYSP